MSTIATDGKVICADTQCTLDNYVLNVSKINIIKNTEEELLILADVSNNVYDSLHFIRWFKDKLMNVYDNYNDGLEFDLIEESRESMSDLDFTCLEIYKSMNKFFMRFWDNGIDSMYINDKIVTIGSGGEYAKSAMYLGKTPYEAILFASQHDAYTNNIIETVDIKLIGESE